MPGTDTNGSSPQPANSLDDVRLLKDADPGGMLGLLAQIPDQLREARRLTRALELPESHRNATSVVLLGMGGSAIGGDLVAGIWSDRLRVPLSVVRGYDLPAWVGPSTLVVASSNSGNTEETLSALGAALQRKSPVVAVTTGGALKTAAGRASLPLLSFPSIGMPRAAIGYSVGLLAGLLERAGFLPLDDAEMEAGATVAAAAVADYAPGVPTDSNRAKQIAWTLLDRLPIIEASGFLSPVARRWKTQLNENSKSTAVWEELPEATHNTVVGYPQPSAVRDHLFAIFLASSMDHPRNRLRAALSMAALDDEKIANDRVVLEDKCRLSQAMRAIVLGDFVSVYLAVLYGIDPTPIEVLTRIKEALSAAAFDGAPTDAPRSQAGS
jgi:glucose/mannose-6-phosphate isomerase